MDVFQECETSCREAELKCGIQQLYRSAIMDLSLEERNTMFFITNEAFCFLMFKY